MIAIRRLAKRLSKQTLSEVKPAPLSETVDHTVDEDCTLSPHQAFQPPSPSLSPPPSPSLSSLASSADEGGSEEEEEEALSAKGKGRPRRHYLKRREVPLHRELVVVDRTSSAEKRKYSQYKYSTEGSSSASSSDDEVKEAFETYLSSPPAWTASSADHTHSAQRPIRVPPSGYRKRVPKYFAQMPSTASIERPRLDFNKMQSKRFLMVRKPVVLRHNCVRVVPPLHPPLELTLDSNQSFQPVPTQT